MTPSREQSKSPQCQSLQRHGHLFGIKIESAYLTSFASMPVTYAVLPFRHDRSRRREAGRLDYLR